MRKGSEMKVVILAGGFGTRLSEETYLRPKPMIEIGEHPILWHIMKYYSAYDYSKYIICLGYKGYMIKEYFANYFLHQSDVTIDLKNNKVIVQKKLCEPWEVTLIDTGLNTMTGGRIKRIKDFVKDQTFMLTYGDGVGDVNLKELVKFHQSQGKYATVTAVKPPSKFGALVLNERNRLVRRFTEKPEDSETWVNGGFFVLEPEVFDYIEGDKTSWEREPLEKLALEGQLVAYKHRGFWQCVDTLRDKDELTAIWNSGHAPWGAWKS